MIHQEITSVVNMEVMIHQEITSVVKVILITPRQELILIQEEVQEVEVVMDTQEEAIQVVMEVTMIHQETM